MKNDNQDNSDPSSKEQTDAKTPTSEKELTRRKLLKAAVAVPALAALSSALPGNSMDEAEARRAPSKKVDNEGDRRIYTLKGHEDIENHFKDALAEAGEGDTFEGLVCVYKNADGNIGVTWHVSSSATVVARTPAGADAPKFYHYRPQGPTVGNYGRIMAEDLKPNELKHLTEQGPGITEKLVALSNSYCGGIYYCG